MFHHLSRFRNRCCVLLNAVAVLSFCAFTPAQTSKELSVDEIVKRANVEVKHYREEFRNLLAKEVKTFQFYDKNSAIKKQRVIVSNFLVYDLSIKKDETTEFRNVLSVDGKPVSKSDDRAVELFEKVSRANSTAKELERIQKESLRFDDEIKMYGLTLFQAIALNEKIRDVMAFELTGTLHSQNGDTYILKYQQIKVSPYINTSGNPPVDAVLDYEFDSVRPVDALIAGTLWIDARTFQIVAEDRRLWVSSKEMTAPGLLTQTRFEFDDSPFGIRVPKMITHTEYRIEKDRMGSKQIEITYEYSAFTRPDVEVITEKPKT